MSSEKKSDGNSKHGGEHVLRCVKPYWVLQEFTYDMEEGINKQTKELQTEIHNAQDIGPEEHDKEKVVCTCGKVFARTEDGVDHLSAVARDNEPIELEFTGRPDTPAVDETPDIEALDWPEFVAKVAEAANERDPSPPDHVAQVMIETPTAFGAEPYFVDRVSPGQVLKSATTHHKPVLWEDRPYRETAVEMLAEALNEYHARFDLEYYD